MTMDRKQVTITLLAGLAGLSLFFNWRIQRQFGPAEEQPVLEEPEREAKREEEPEPAAEPPPTGEVVARTRLIPGADYTLTVFYVGDKEVGRLKRSGNKVLEKRGTIPDGRVTTVDEYKKTRGEAYYWDGKRQGQAVTYYPDGTLKSEAEYFNGDLLSKTEYYPDGKVRFEVDYRNARAYDDKEVGVGKLYYPNGNLKYEWNITRDRERGFKKSYNRDGTLRAVTYIDEYGNVIETVER